MNLTVMVKFAILSLTLNESNTYMNIHFLSIKKLKKSRTKESCRSGLYLFDWPQY